MKCPNCEADFPCKSKLDRHLNSKIKCTDKMNTKNFIKRSKQKFGDRFSYDKTIYVNAKTNIIIKCNQHDEDLLITAQNHLNGNGGCHKCSGVYIKSYDEIIQEFIEIHANKFIYDEETRNSYKNNNSILKILCPMHGYFNQSVRCHKISGRCDDCIIESLEKKHKIKINSIDRTKKIYSHPKYKNYSINIETDLITNSNNSRTSKGTKNNRGTTDFIVYYDDKRYTISLHRFKYEAVYNELLPEDCEIDHCNQNPSDNTIDNLQCLTRAEHAVKTAIDNPDRYSKIGRTQGSSGTAYNPETKDTIEFESVRDLAQKLDYNSGANVFRFLRTGKYPPKGYSVITFDSYEVIEGEEWKKHTTLKFEVSNMGRIKDRRRITYGSLESEGKYYMYSGNKVHKLVMETFGPEKPSPMHTVDHENRETKDNRITNLRWATKSEQCLNQTRYV